MHYYMAPMEGVTTDVFRRAYHNHFLPFDKYFTPFIVPYEKQGFAVKEWREIAPERNIGMRTVPQILTNDAIGFIQTAKKLQAFGYDEVNLNLGCPSKTVAGKGRGSGFLAFPEQLDRFLDDIFSNTDIKISVKTRIGKESPLEFKRLLAIYEKYPMEELIIHPRVQTDLYRNQPNYDMYEYAVEMSEHRLCYNGDINRKEDEEKLLERFPDTDLIMIGRGVVHNPFLIEELKGLRVKGQMDIADKERMRLFHNDMMDGYREICRTEKNLLYKMKEVWFFIGDLFPEKSENLVKIRKSQDISAMMEEVEFILS